MTRKLSTPGVAETETTTPADQTQVDQTDVGTEENTELVQQSNQSDSLPEPQVTIDLSEIIESQKRIESKIDQLLKAGGIEVPKKKVWRQGKHGMEYKEI
ncbi:hypothetical protein [Acinetobacter sp. WCHAc060025]|uniref:hypothetical protein n=1 Tax=Acinetobacter sp. WCHAc060025 TaxID=2518625 RepID=UPI00102321E0|nr:hypothetical protein [Acinetobacter sp. WCHAc060025]RZG74825.1 hypothetical protein EXE09_12625 [Acinetobacter sp. WCHAc060025]